MFAPYIVMQSDLSTDRRPKLKAWIVMDVIDYLDLASFRLIVIALEIADQTIPHRFSYSFRRGFGCAVGVTS
ncbi:MAG: hypothetical protein ACNY01_10920 [Desulfobacteria bacterium]